MMKLADRAGTIIEQDTAQDRLLAWMYGHITGRLLLKPLVCPFVSKLGGKVLDTRLSAMAVRPFVKANHIDLTQCEKQKFNSYNDFFTRRLKAGARPVAMEDELLPSPCDGRLSVYQINDSLEFSVKHTRYTVTSLLKNKKLAGAYAGGFAWVFRLCVEDYHRYIYVDDGVTSSNYHIPGVFHTVNPVANDCYPIYKENTREYSLLHSENFGTILMMEVGALMVGKIENPRGAGSVKRGQEKGNFAFGGSTVILLTQAGSVYPDRDILKNSRHHIETKVRQGEQVGSKKE